MRPHKNLSVLKGSVIDIEDISLSGVDVVIHLASVANDPCGDLNPLLTWETSALGTMKLAEKAAKSKVKQFLYASSGSVYGVKSEERVTEDLPLDPISGYNKTKMVAERVVSSYDNEMAIQIIRPATVCGLSPRMRLDVSVNLLTMAALTKGEITVYGGQQTRPNVHIHDITDVYLHFIDNPTITGVFNVGFENLSILQIAEIVASYVEAKIFISESNDPRSYRVCSDKLLGTGFQPKRSVKNAIEEIISAHRSAQLIDEPHFHNLRWMQEKLIA